MTVFMMLRERDNGGYHNFGTQSHALLQKQGCCARLRFAIGRMQRKLDSLLVYLSYSPD